MDQGIAALLGAGVGAAGAAFGSVVTAKASRWQVRQQAAHTQRQAQRQLRRDAYAAILQAAEKVMEAHATWRAHLEMLSPGTTVVTRRWQEELDAANRDLNQAAAVVMLEGPKLARTASQGLRMARNDWRAALRTWQDVVANRGSLQDAQDRASQMEQRFNDAYVSFVAAATDVLALPPAADAGK
ncbi:hypothetical protein ACFW9N_39175 [Streptomyces sp. NPDC059496]|uniref:hypothetical protein n=1 Tax=Streptomyces sp. NPDC059496 TaxID=3346851 RepID=UPI0036784B35